MKAQRSFQSNCVFDPSLCPLLAGLSPEDQQARMASDPMIRACVQSIAEGKAYPERCAMIPGKPDKTAESARKRMRRTRIAARA
ncbi:MAG TPA: hypothetical protein PLQ11_08360 [Beijerinckiaceae bacterium]|nr:hypothetical protein [Beijerinckiaceae bacterium]